LGLPTSLHELEIALDDIELATIAEETTRMVLIHNNPRTATESDCLAILEQMR